MKITLAAFAALVLSSCTSGPFNRPEQAITVLYGQTSFEDDAIDDSVKADTFGIVFEYAESPSDDPVAPLVSEVGFSYGRTDTYGWIGGPSGPSDVFDVEMETYEVTLGVRQDWRLGRWTPFLGVGLDTMMVDVSALGGDEQTARLGGYAKLGARYAISDRWSLGAELRYRAFEEFSLGSGDSEIEGDLGGASMMVGMTWSF